MAFRDDYVENHRLAFRDEIALIAWQFGKLRKFEPLHDGLNASQIITLNENLMGGKDQLEGLFVTATREFREHELIVRQQERTFRGKFNA